MRKVAIIYDSRTGTTKAASEQMAQAARSAGWECDIASVDHADPKKVSTADAICIGSWTQGLFFILQHPTRKTLQFIDRLEGLAGRPAAVFCTYKTSPGGMLSTMAQRLSSRGACVTGELRSRGPTADPRFAAWLGGLPAAREPLAQERK